MREVEQLSLEQLCGQLLVVGFSGTELPTELGHLLGRKLRGGVILFRRNLNDPRGAWQLCRSIARRTDASFPAFIAVDQEGGRVRRLTEGVLDVPAFRALGALDDLDLSLRVASAQATELLTLGFNVNFSPVVDVDSNPDNPIIGDRAFGSTPELVTRHGLQFIRGFQSHGLMACIKHFPGHGDTHSDSHVELPVVERSTLSLRQIELYPFERLARHAAAAMSAHVVLRAFDSVPATFSPRLCTTLLRREFGFEGVLFSDDLEMGAVYPRFPIEESAVRAVEAGCDALLVCSDETLQVRAHSALVARAQKDDAFRLRCIQAVERSVAQRRKFAPRAAEKFSAVQALWAEHALLTAELKQRLL